MGLREFVSDPRFQSKDLQTKRAMLADYGVDEADFGPLLAFKATPEKQAEAPKGAAESFVNRGVDTLKGLGGLALDAGQSALSLEGQATFLPRLAKGLYEGAVDAGANAVARQFPQGMDNQPEDANFYRSAARGGAAAVPVVGPYVMNKVSDLEEGKGAQVAGETAFDLASMMIPKGATIVNGRIVKPITKGLQKYGSVATEVAKETAKDWIPGVKQYAKVTSKLNKAKKAAGAPAEAAAKAEAEAMADSFKAAKAETNLIERADRFKAKDAKAAREQFEAAKAERDAAKAPAEVPETAPAKPTEAAPARSMSERTSDVEGAAQAVRASTLARMKHVIKRADPVAPSGDVVHAPPAFPGQRSGATKARYEFQAQRQAKLKAEARAAQTAEIADRIVKEFGIGGKPSEIKSMLMDEYKLSADDASKLVNMIRGEIK